MSGQSIFAKSRKRMLGAFTGRVAYVPPYVVLFAGLLVTAIISTTFYRNAQQDFLSQQYNEQATPLALSLGRSVDRYLETVHQIAALYTSSNAVTRSEFGAFVERSLVRNPGIQALEWIPRVASADREWFEEAAKRDGVRDFQITERTPSGELRDAIERAEHFPVFYVEPRAGNEAALGFDLASNPARLEALNRARDTGEAVATQRIRLVQETGDQFGLLVFVPVYDSTTVPGTVAERRRKLSGFALGVFRIGDMLHSALQEVGDPDFLDVYIFDTSAPPDARFLHYHKAKQHKVETPPLSEEEILAGEYFASSLPLAGRSWQVVFAPRPGFRALMDWMLWIVTGFGLTITAVLVLYLRSVRTRSLDIEQVVTDRTRQLKISNQALEEEMAERVRADQEHREREYFLQMVTDNIPVVITYFYADMKIGFINKLGASWFDGVAEDIVGKVVYDVIESLDVDEFKDSVRKVLAGEPQSYESEIIYPDGVTRQVIIDYVPHLDAKGSVVGYFGIVQDVSQRKAVERQLSQAQKMEAIGHLTGGIAHDFNNLLMVIGGYTRRAFDASDNPDKVRSSLAEAMKGTDRAAQLTKQLLSFSRRQVIEKRVFRVDETIAEIEDLMQRSTGERHRVNFAANCGSNCIETDEGEFGQALLNLVINARDAMPDGGAIEVATNIVELDESFTKTRQELVPGRYVEVSVADQGTGIDAETLDHIYEPFFTTKDQGKGTGLGLAMVYGFAQQSGGTIDVDSTVGEGATFKIYLPVSDRDPEVLIADVEEDQHGKGETILLVEDDRPVLDLVSGMLEALDYNVLTANDGLEALEVEAEHEEHIDLILSDVVMPGLGGFEAASMVRESRPEVKLVFMSGYPNRGVAGEDVMPVNSQFLQKPVDPNHLARVLRKELDGLPPRNPTISIAANEPRVRENVSG